jgi:sporulation protein YlmC with PRC-barrel domain
MLEDTNFSSLMSRHVIDSNSQKIGRITDAIIDKRSLSVNAFVIKGSGQPMVFLSQIAKLTDKDIVLNKSKSQLKSVQGSDLKQEESLFSEVKKIPIIDKNGETIGIFTDIYFRKGSSPAFQVGGQEFINFLKKKYWTENLTYLLENKDIELTQEGFMLKTNLKELELI